MGWIPDSDVNAIHDNVAGEIAALTEKETPADADLVIIEDSEDSNSKKKVQVGNLPGGGAEELDGLTDVDLSTPPTDGQVLKYDDGSGMWVAANDDTGSGSLPTASAKGDIAVYDGDSWEILTAGDDDDVLTADSGESLGVKWAAPSGGGGGGFAQYGDIVTPPTTGWSWFNQGSATLTVDASGTHVLNTPAAGANNLVGRVRSHSSGDVHTLLLGGQGRTAHAGFGVCFQSASGQLVVAYLKAGSTTLTFENWNSPTSFASSLAGGTLHPSPLEWFQVEDNGSNLLFRVGAAGLASAFVQIGSVGRTAFLTGGPTAVGFMVRDNSAATVAALLSWETT